MSLCRSEVRTFGGILERDSERHCFREWEASLHVIVEARREVGESVSLEILRVRSHITNDLVVGVLEDCCCSSRIVEFVGHLIT